LTINDESNITPMARENTKNTPVDPGTVTLKVWIETDRHGGSRRRTRVNWEAIGAVGEILGATAVVLTLGYLARQVHFAKAAATDANRLNRANGVQTMQLAIATNPELSHTVAKAHGLAPFHEAFAEEFGLTSDEAARADWVHSYYFWLHWGQYGSSSTAADLSELSNVIEHFYSKPAVKYSWDNSPYGKPIFESGFVDFVDKTLSDAE
jgi:hypothetical protein